MSFSIDADLDYTDIFCGAGGSSIGLAAAGMEWKARPRRRRPGWDTRRGEEGTA